MSNINLSIDVFSLHDGKCPDFTTFSYVWGSETLSKEIKIDGKSLAVTENLFQLLLALHPGSALPHKGPEDPRQRGYYWIDAVCIDQNNPTECGQQVSIMCDIYSKSTCTLVWLGGDYEDSDRAIDLVEELGHPNALFRSNECVTTLLLNPDARASWLALDKLFHRPYWQRAWIRQEYVLSKKIVVMCGQHSCDGLALQNALFCLGSALNFYTGIPHVSRYLMHESEAGYTPIMIGNPEFEEAKTARDLRMYLTILKIRLPLLCILDKSVGVISTDARDLIYGVLGLARDFNLLCPRPDYTASVATVYAEYVKAQIQEYKNLDVVCYGRPGRIQAQLPTWVPDWSGQMYGVY